MVCEWVDGRPHAHTSDDDGGGVAYASNTHRDAPRTRARTENMYTHAGVGGRRRPTDEGDEVGGISGVNYSRKTHWPTHTHARTARWTHAWRTVATTVRFELCTHARRRLDGSPQGLLLYPHTRARINTATPTRRDVGEGRHTHSLSRTQGGIGGNLPRSRADTVMIQNENEFFSRCNAMSILEQQLQQMRKHFQFP